MNKFAPDPALAVAIFGSAALDSPEAIDSNNLPGDDAADDATMQAPFELFFDRAALERLDLTKSAESVRTSSLAKTAVTTRFGIARTEERLIDGTRWVVAFDADGNLVDSQELEPGPLGKGSSEPGWDDEFMPSPSSNDLHKRAKGPKVARTEKTVYPLTGTTVIAELDENNVCIRTYRIEA